MRVRLIVSLGAVVGVLALGYGAYTWYQATHYVWTDDAYVEGTISPISAKVAGPVVELHVRDNQLVKRGELLVRVDPRDYDARVAQARAAVATAEAALRAARSDVPLTRESTSAQIDQARAALEASVVAVRSSDSAVDQARAALEAKRAAVAAMRADVVGAESAQREAGRELERQRALLKRDLIAPRDFDRAESAAETAGAVVEATRRRLTATEREVQQAEAELAARLHAVDQAKQRVAELRASLAHATSQTHQVAMKDAEVSRAEAHLKETQADLAFAELQLLHTEIRAPLDGNVSKRSVEVGQIVQMGQPLLAIVPLHDVWVLANLKETQLARIRAGQRAEIRVDGFPEKTFTGVVNSVAAGTGARFSLLPPENATGNWVKVVQRVPVKILLDPKEVGNPHTLRAGMSVGVSIRVK